MLHIFVSACGCVWVRASGHKHNLFRTHTTHTYLQIMKKKYADEEVDDEFDDEKPYTPDDKLYTPKSPERESQSEFNTPAKQREGRDQWPVASEDKGEGAQGRGSDDVRKSKERGGRVKERGRGKERGGRGGKGVAVLGGGRGGAGESVDKPQVEKSWTQRRKEALKVCVYVQAGVIEREGGRDDIHQYHTHTYTHTRHIAIPHIHTHATHTYTHAR